MQEGPSLLNPPPPRPEHTGPYSLSFFYTGLSRPRDGFPSFQATAYLNDQDFFHYDSEDRKAIPSYPWSQMEGIEDWEKESELQKAREDIFMVTLKDIMDYYKDKEDSSCLTVPPSGTVLPSPRPFLSSLML